MCHLCELENKLKRAINTAGAKGADGGEVLTVVMSVVVDMLASVKDDVQRTEFIDVILNNLVDDVTTSMQDEVRLAEAESAGATKQ